MMVFKRLKQLANKKGWNIEKNCIYGEENGYLFTLFDGNGFKAIVTPLPRIEDQAKQRVLSFLGENKKRIKIWKYGFDNNVLAVKFHESFRNTKLEVIEELIQTMTEFLKTQEIPGKNYCIICGQDQANQIVNIGNIYYDIHDGCCTTFENEVESAKRQFDSEEKNYFLGFLGAMLGGLIASIPWIVVQIAFSKIAAVCAYLIGFGATKAYFLCKGRFGSLTKWLISLVVIFTVILAQFMIISFELLKAGIALTYRNYQLLFNNQEMTTVFGKNLSLALFMALLGILPLFFELKGTAKNFFPKIKRE
jgi:hypothetical protein